MGAGASRQHHNHHFKPLPTSPTPRGDSLPSLKHSIQSQMSVQDQRSSPEIENEETEEEVNDAPDNTDWKASPNDTLEKYKIRYPDHADSLETMLNSLEALKNFVDHPRKFDEVIHRSVRDLLKMTFVDMDKSGTPEAEKLSTLVDFAIIVGGAEKLKQFAQHCFNEYLYVPKEVSNNEDESDEETSNIILDYACNTGSAGKCLVETLQTIQNIAYFHTGFCLACANAGVILMCLENITRIDAENPNWEQNNGKLVELTALFTAILHNISRRLRDRELFANSEKTLLYFAKKKVAEIAASSLFALAYSVDEKTNDQISADEELLHFIIKLLDKACKSETRNAHTFTVKGLADGLSQLAINDTNNKVLGQKGVIPVLISVIKTSNEDEEKGSATRALWVLAFDGNNKEKVRQEEGAMGILHQLQQSKNSEVQKAAAGALWELEGKTARQSSERIESTGNHVMISYQWDSQKVLVELKNRLRASGYRVWMDLEQMRGSTLEAMAEGIENSSVVLICVSERYKNSLYCRTEAKYAFHKRKDIIPLMMQRNYMPDGWLGLIVGEKFWHDFQSKHVLEQSVTRLIRELGGRGKELDVTDGPSEPAVRAVQADDLAPPSFPGVSTWTNEEVKQWFKEIGLEKVCKEDISEMNGQSLTGLQQLREECPDYFYRCLERDFNLTNILDVLKFTRELRKLCQVA